MPFLPNRWSDAEAADRLERAGDDAADRDLALRVYTSRLIGAEPDLVMHGGGNTSVKTVRAIDGGVTDVLHIKGSGWDLDSIEARGMPGVRLAALRALRTRESVPDEEMVAVQRAALIDDTSPTPSVETLLHAYLPHRYVDHTHATPFLVLANLPNVVEVTAEVFGDQLALVPYHMPGYALGRAAAEAFEANPSAEGLLLVQHGHVAFGATAEESYGTVLRHTNTLAAYFGMAGPTLIGDRIPAGDEELGRLRAALVAADPAAPPPVFDLRNGPEVMRVLARPDMADLATRGVASPDHVIRTKARPLVLRRGEIGAADIARAVATYVADYTAYFERQCARTGRKVTMLSPRPGLAWIEGLGLVGIGDTAKAARIAADLGEQNLRVRAVAEDAGGFYPIGEDDLFDMEYWSLEQAKLARPAAANGG